MAPGASDRDPTGLAANVLIIRHSITMFRKREQLSRFMFYGKRPVQRLTRGKKATAQFVQRRLDCGIRDALGVTLNQRVRRRPRMLSSGSQKAGRIEKTISRSEVDIDALRRSLGPMGLWVSNSLAVLSSFR
jgi:hypothetical protein